MIRYQVDGAVLRQHVEMKVTRRPPGASWRDAGFHYLVEIAGPGGAASVVIQNPHDTIPGDVSRVRARLVLELWDEDEQRVPIEVHPVRRQLSE